MNQIDQLLSELPEEVQYDVINSIEYKEAKRGELLVNIGEVCRYLYYIENGLLRTYCINDRGNDVNIEFSMEGQFITSITSFYDVSASPVAIESMEDSRLLCISHDKLYGLYERHPLMNKIGRLVTEQNFVRREHWHTNKYSMNGADRYKNLLENSPSLIQRVPLSQLASYLGMTKEHLSRIRAEI